MTFKRVSDWFRHPGTQHLDDWLTRLCQTRNADVPGRTCQCCTPRYRGRIVLTRDPDGEERCVACNLCAAVCPVGCISLQKAEHEDGRWYPEFFSVSTFRVVSFVWLM